MQNHLCTGFNREQHIRTQCHVHQLLFVFYFNKINLPTSGHAQQIQYKTQATKTIFRFRKLTSSFCIRQIKNAKSYFCKRFSPLYNSVFVLNVNNCAPVSLLSLFHRVLMIITALYRTLN